MSEHEKKLDGLDFAQGVALGDIADGGIILGHVAGDAVLLARRGHELLAIGAVCTHYHGPLAEGVLVEDTVRCAWHHACFSLRTGEALRAPGLNPVPCWRVELRNGRSVFEKRSNRQRAERGRHGSLRRSPSSSSAGARPGKPPRRCYGMRAIPARSRC
jgi:nitrite reductase/ring-hydroxylating ferredoxin subunit